ncbi:MAG: PAS domain-containing protein, partial [Alphaproteobacteria bacterium]|nr:PAS domain-containing protein [Alphaproteobacteria bacterium]
MTSSDLTFDFRDELLTLAEQSAGIGIWDRDVATGLMRGTPTFYRIMGLEPTSEPVPMEVVRAVRHPDDAQRVIDGFQAAIAQGLDTYEVEYRIIRPSDGQVRWIFGRGRTLRDGSGTPMRYSGVDIDITERKQAEEQARLLMQEVNHRSNNLLAVVQAIARQMANGSADEAFAERLSQRIQGIAAANGVLVSGRWQGAGLESLIESQLSPFTDFATRVVADGPTVQLKRNAARSVGLALHELATNAAKYGALSNNDGKVRVAWKIEDEAAGPRFHLRWAEHGGPPVAPPQRQGFGHTVTARMIEGALGGKARIDFAPGGVAWSFDCPA